MSLALPAHIQINAPIHPGFEHVLTADALALVTKLHRAFEAQRQALLAARTARQARIDAGEMPDFLPETKAIRAGDWRIAPLPAALHRRRTEITGPVERKMIINAFNSGADSYMTDFEDSNSPNWFNQVQGQINLFEAIRRTISYTNEAGKEYRLNERTATLQVRMVADDASSSVGTDSFPETRDGQTYPVVVKKQVVLTGDRFVATAAESHALRAELAAALAVDMESAAVAQVCHDYGVPFCAVRTISDRADDTAHVDFSRFVATVAIPQTLSKKLDALARKMQLAATQAATTIEQVA